MSDGFFLMHRGWRENPIFRGEFSRADAWVWLIETACWRPTRFDLKGKIITLERGQLCVSRERLAEVWQWSASAVERFLTRLKTEQMIGRETGQGKSVITICNYEKYQDQSGKTGQKTGHKTGQRSDRDRTAKEQGNKETIEGSNDPSPPIAPQRDHDWPEIPDWIPVAPWNGWLDMRRREGSWPTARAIELTLGKLGRWREKGHDPGAILDNSTERNWTGIFEPKDQANGHRGQANGGPASGGNRNGGRTPDGLATALHRRIAKSRSECPADEAGRSDAGEAEEFGALPAPAVGSLL